MYDSTVEWLIADVTDVSTLHQLSVFHAWVIVRLTLRYTTPDIHCRNRRYECDGRPMPCMRMVLTWLMSSPASCVASRCAASTRDAGTNNSFTRAVADSGTMPWRHTNQRHLLPYQLARFTLITHADIAAVVGRAFNVCLSVCPRSNRKTARAINTKLGTRILHSSRSACIDPEVKRSKVKVTLYENRYGARYLVTTAGIP